VNLIDEFIINKEVWKTKGAHFNGADFELQVISLGVKDKEKVIESANYYQMGNTNRLTDSIIGQEAGEWGFTYNFLNGQLDGAGRMTKGGFDIENPPKTRTEALENLKRFIFSMYKLQEGKPWFSMNGYYNWQHYAGEFGATQIGSEIGENVNSYQMHIAFTRGAARQYNVPWVIDFSSWYGGLMRDWSPAKTWEQSGASYGHSLNLTERSFVMSYMSGASAILAEAGASIGFYDTIGKNGYYDVTPYGDLCRKFYDFVKQNRDIGIVYSPIAIVLDYYHGIESGWDEKTVWATHKINKAFGQFDYNSGDYMTKDLLMMIYGDSYVIDNTVLSPESTKLVNRKYTDFIDVLLQNASKTVINSYPAVILSGDITLSDEETEKFREYADNGGILVLNTAYLKFFPEYAQNSTLTDVLTIRRGAGKVIIYGSDHKADRLEKIIENLYHELSLVDVFGEVEVISSINKKNVYVTLINNEGVTKEPEKEEIIDKKIKKRVSLRLCQGLKFSNVRDIYNNHSLNINKDTVSLTLKAGDIAVLKFSI